MTSTADITGMSLHRSGATAVFMTAATNAALAVLALATGVLVARLLGPAGRGHLAAAQAVGTLVGAIGSLSLGEALVFFVGRRNRPPMVVLQTSVLFAAVSTTVLITAATFLMPTLLVGQPEAVNAARTYTLIGLPFILLGFPITFMRALQRYQTWNLLRLITPICWLVAILLFTVTRQREVQPLIVAFVLLQVLFIPLVWLLARRSVSGMQGVDRSLVMPMLRYGTPLFLATLPLALNLRLDQLLIANFQSADQLGLYAVSVSWAGIGLPLMTAIGSVLFPKLAGMGREDGAEVLARSTRIGVAIGLLIGALSAVTAPTLVPLLFGRQFVVPLAIPCALGAATSILGVNEILEEGLRGLGEPKTVLAGEVSGLLVTVLLLFILVPRVGILGGAVASLAGYTVVNVILVWRTSARVQVGISRLLVPRRADLQGLLLSASNITARLPHKQDET